MKILLGGERVVVQGMTPEENPWGKYQFPMPFRDDDTLITKIPTIQTNTKEEMTVTVYCANCVYLFQRGGVWYCGCTTSDLYDKAVDPNWGKCCDYHKSR